MGVTAAHGIACRLQELGAAVGLVALIDNGPRSSADEGLPDTDQFLAALVEQYNVQASHLFADVARICVNNLRISRKASLRRFNGDVCFFQSTFRHGRSRMDPEAWRPYVTGRIAVHEINAQHEDLLAPVPALSRSEAGPAWSLYGRER